MSTSAGGYKELLRIPGVARIITAQLVARFPSGMLSLALLLHVEQREDSYASAGLVLAAMSVGQAVAGPMLSRLMGAIGMRPVLFTSMLLCALALVVIALAPLELAGFIAFGLLVGLTLPPVQSAVRTIYPKMVPARSLTPLFSLDASAQEIIWIGGPVAVTFVATQISTVAGILLCVVLLIGGGCWFIGSPELGRVRIPRSRNRFGAVLRKPPVLVSTVIGLLLIGACSAIEASVVATFGHGGADAGLVLAIWALASLVGGFASGGLRVAPWSLARRLLVVFLGLALAAAMLEFWWLALTLSLSGLGLAPALAVLSMTVSASVRFSDTAEAYGWIGTGQLLGAALGSAFVGLAIDAGGPGRGFVVAAVLALAATITAALCVRWMPDLRTRDAAPMPETAPVPVTPA